MTLCELAFYWRDGAHNSNFESHRVKATFSHLTHCVRRCSSPAAILTKAFGLNVFDLMEGNGRLLAWTTTKVKINITISTDMYASSLVMVIDLASLLRDNDVSSPIVRQRTKMQYRRIAKMKLRVGDKLWMWKLTVVDRTRAVDRVGAYHCRLTSTNFKSSTTLNPLYIPHLPSTQLGLAERQITPRMPCKIDYHLTITCLASR